MNDEIDQSKFRKYPSIINHYKERELKFARELITDKTPFVVEEKADGANFSFWASNDGTVTPARRKAFLTDQDKFFGGWKTVYDKYELQISMIADKVFLMYPNLENVVVYGELIGGMYNHDDVKKSQVSKINNRVQYHPELRFIAYDIRIISESRDSFLNTRTKNMLFEDFEIPYTNILFEGTFDECLKHSNEFQTKIPGKWKMPTIEGNVCEGIIIRPIFDITMYNGSRLIFKSKNDKFLEPTEKKKKERPVMTMQAQSFADSLTVYLDKRRFESAASKIGPPDWKLFSEFAKEVSGDILEDPDIAHDLDTLFNAEEIVLIKKEFGNSICQELRAWFRKVT